jgi:hypothetical protein
MTDSQLNLIMLALSVAAERWLSYSNDEQLPRSLREQFALQAAEAQTLSVEVANMEPDTDARA